jgi:hypothetical protein
MFIYLVRSRVISMQPLKRLLEAKFCMFWW